MAYDSTKKNEQKTKKTKKTEGEKSKVQGETIVRDETLGQQHIGENTDETRQANHKTTQPQGKTNHHKTEQSKT
jgi:hypothetical protein